MKTPPLYALAAATALVGMSETAPLAAAERPAPLSLDQIRADALQRLSLGEIEMVRHTRYHRRKMRRSRWCGYRRYYGKRCYYTPRLLKPFRQG